MVDILMSTYNGEKFIKVQLDSLLNQTYQDIHIIIRDDGSSDNTLAIIDEYQNNYPDIFEVYKETNIGWGKSFMELLSKSRSELICFCDQDDVWHEDKIARMVNYFYDNKIDKPFLLACDMQIVDKELNLINPSYYKFTNRDFNNFSIEEIISKSYCPPGCSMMINNKLKEITRYQKRKVIVHDFYMYLIAKLFADTAILPVSLQDYRQHENNASGGATKSGLTYYLNRLLHYRLKDVINYLKYLLRRKDEINARKEEMISFYDNYKEMMDEEIKDLFLKYTK